MCTAAAAGSWMQGAISHGFNASGIDHDPCAPVVSTANPTICVQINGNSDPEQLSSICMNVCEHVVAISHHE